MISHDHVTVLERIKLMPSNCRIRPRSFSFDWPERMNSPQAVSITLASGHDESALLHSRYKRG